MTTGPFLSFKRPVRLSVANGTGPHTSPNRGYAVTPAASHPQPTPVHTGCGKLHGKKQHGPRIQSLLQPTVPQPTTMPNPRKETLGRQHPPHENNQRMGTTTTRPTRHRQTPRNLPHLRRHRSRRSRPRHPTPTGRTGHHRKHAAHPRQSMSPGENTTGGTAWPSNA